jgi:WD40 repeat protein
VSGSIAVWFETSRRAIVRGRGVHHDRVQEISMRLTSLNSNSMCKRAARVCGAVLLAACAIGAAPSVVQDGQGKGREAAPEFPAIELGGHAGSRVYCLAFSPDGTTLATGSLDRTVKLWDIPAGRERSALHDDSGAILSLAFSPDGQTIAWTTSDAAGAIALWDVKAQRLQKTLRGHAGRVQAIAFSPDGQTLASGGADGTMKLWNSASGRERATLKGHKGSILAVAYSPDGKTIASGSGAADRSVILWDIVEGRPRLTLEGQKSPVMSLAFSPDGQTLASAGSQQFVVEGNRRTFGPGEVLLWDVVAGRLKSSLKGHDGLISSVAFAPNGKTLASGGQDTPAGRLILWDVAAGKERARMSVRPRGVRVPADRVCAVAFSPDGRWVATGASDGGVVLWDVRRLRLAQPGTPKAGP